MELELKKLNNLDLIEYSNTILKKYCISTGELFIFELNLLINIQRNILKYELLENKEVIEYYDTLEEGIKEFKKISGKDRKIEAINLEEIY